MIVENKSYLALLAVYLHCTSVFVKVCYHHNLGIVVFGHLLICSGLTHLEVSKVVSPDFFCPLVCSFFFIILRNLLQGSVLTRRIQFCILYESGVLYNSFAIPVFVS